MRENVKNKCIIFGIGNSGRQDDGLGWAFLDLLKKNEFEKASFEYKYQLQIEDAELICNYDTVLVNHQINTALVHTLWYLKPFCICQNICMNINQKPISWQFRDTNGN